MTSEFLAASAAIVLSLALSYLPGLSPKWDALTTDMKRVWTAALLVAVAGGAYALSCAGLGAQLGIAVTCDQGGAVEAVKALIAALIASQGTYLLTKG